MAKKSKAKKRKQAHKKAVSSQPNKVASSTKTHKPDEQVVDSSQTEETYVVSADKQESETVTEVVSENPPRQGISQKWLIFALAGVVIVLLGLLWFLYNKTQQATLDTQKAAQDQLLKVNEATGDSLGPASGSDSANPQPSGSATQGSSGSELQPQQQTTPAQLDQLQ